MTIKHQFIANSVFKPRIIQSNKTTIHNLSQVLIIRQSFHFWET